MVRRPVDYFAERRGVASRFHAAQRSETRTGETFAVNTETGETRIGRVERHRRRVERRLRRRRRRNDG